MPGRLATLVSNLPPSQNYSVDKLIDDHSLFPLFRLFLFQDRILSIKEDLIGKNGSIAYTRLGLTACSIPLPGPEDLRFCPVCITEDKNRWGECYWHRVHQAPGVEVCPIHRVILHKISKNTLKVGFETDFLAAESIVDPPSPTIVDTTDFCQAALLNIAIDMAWILNQHDLSCDLDFFDQRYFMLLTDRGFVNRSSRRKFDILALMRQLKAYYPAHFLQMLSCELTEHETNNWLFRLLYRRDYTTHPLYHLLFIHFLGYSIETFVGLSSPRNQIPPSPFGLGPWPCLNPASPHYGQRVIQDCSISSSTDDRPKGVFTCECGFVYSRIKPDTCEDDSFKADKVLAVGYVWEETLRKLWGDPDISQVDLARRLGLHAHAIQCHAFRLGLSFPRPGGQVPQPSQKLQVHLYGEQISDQERESYRLSWISAIQENPGIGTEAIHKKFPKIYKWLYRHDRAWQKEHRPPRPKLRQIRKPILDWNELDRRNAEVVTEIALQMKKSKDLPEKITRAALLRRIEKGKSLKRYLAYGKFPLTAQALDSVIEPPEEFVIRRICWIRERYLQEEHILPKRETLIKQTGATNYMKSQRVREAIDDAMLTLKALDLPLSL